MKPSTCVASNFSGQVAMFPSGTWSQPKDAATGFATHIVSCLTPRSCAAAGAYGIYMFNGSAWVNAGLGNGYVFYSLSCIPTTLRCTAGGQDGFGGGTWAYDGRTWKVVTPPPSPDRKSVV